MVIINTTINTNNNNTYKKKETLLSTYYVSDTVQSILYSLTILVSQTPMRQLMSLWFNSVDSKAQGSRYDYTAVGD